MRTPYPCNYGQILQFSEYFGLQKVLKHDKWPNFNHHIFLEEFPIDVNNVM